MHLVLFFHFSRCRFGAHCLISNVLLWLPRFFAQEHLMFCISFYRFFAVIPFNFVDGMPGIENINHQAAEACPSVTTITC